MTFTNTVTGYEVTQTVSLTVSAALELTPDASFYTQGPSGGPVVPATTTYELTNLGGSELDWAVEWAAEWLEVSPSSGTLAAYGSVEVTVTPVADALLEGNYADTLLFTCPLVPDGISRDVVLGIADAPANAIHWFPMDSDPGWTVEGEWAFGIPSGQGGTTAGYADPVGGASGGNAYGINLDGDYSDAVAAAQYLTAGPLDCSGYRNVSVQFKRWLNAYQQSEVFETVEVSNDGATWTTVWQNELLSVEDAAWTTKTYNLSAVADDSATVYVRWGHEVAVGSAPAFSGWNLDDVAILGTLIDDLYVTPAENVLFEGVVGGPFAPDGVLYVLTNTGGASVNWTAAASDTWFEAVPASGTLAYGDVAWVTIAPTAAAEALDAALYAGSVTFTNSSSAAEQVREVNAQRCSRRSRYPR